MATQNHHGEDIALTDRSIQDENRSSEKRFTLRLSPEAVDALEQISRYRNGATYQEIIRRAIGTELFLVQAIANGASIVLEKPGHRSKEIVLR